MEIPRIISVDDHVIEPPGVWTDRLAARFGDRAPTLVRGVKGGVRGTRRAVVFKQGGGEELADCWSYEGTLFPILTSMTSSGLDRSAIRLGAVTYDQILPACYDQ